MTTPTTLLALFLAIAAPLLCYVVVSIVLAARRARDRYLVSRDFRQFVSRTVAQRQAERRRVMRAVNRDARRRGFVE